MMYSTFFRSCTIYEGYLKREKAKQLAKHQKTCAKNRKKRKKKKR